MKAVSLLEKYLWPLLHDFVVEGFVVTSDAVDDVAGLADGFEVAGCAFEFAVFCASEL